MGRQGRIGWIGKTCATRHRDRALGGDDCRGRYWRWALSWGSMSVVTASGVKACTQLYPRRGALAVPSRCSAGVLLCALGVLSACSKKADDSSKSDEAAQGGEGGAAGQATSTATTPSTSGEPSSTAPATSEPNPAPEGTANSTAPTADTASSQPNPSSEPTPAVPADTTAGASDTASAETDETVANETSSGGEGGAGSSETAASGVGGTAEPPSGDPCAAALLCDDFDDDVEGVAPPAPWTSDTNGGSVEVSTERAFSGSNSVHVSNSAGAYKRAFFSVAGEPLFPSAGQEMYGRMMMWLDATPAGSVHWTFIQGEGPADDGSYDIFYRYGGQHEGKLMANFETQGKATDCWDHSETVMPTQTWACIEWRFNTATDEMQFWLDGTELTDIHPVGTGEGCVNQDLNGAWPAPAQFEVLRLGWEKYQESTQLDAWIDDVVVGTSKVGCPVVPAP
jgi:hypothetical protein